MTQFEEVIVELSYNCNLSCGMCGFGKEVNPYSKSKFMTFPHYREILDQFGSKTKAIRLNGRGESVIHPDFIQILDYTKEKFSELNVNLFSNFSFNSGRIIDALIRNRVQLFVSMDSPYASELEIIRKGAKFKFIDANLRKMQEVKNRPFIVFTIQESNTHRILDMAKYAIDLNCNILYNTIRRDVGIDGFVKIVSDKSQFIADQFSSVTALFEGEEVTCAYPDQLAGVDVGLNKSTATHGTMISSDAGSKSGCPALHRELCILYDGTTTPCNMFNPYVYGNILGQPLSDIWQGKERREFLVSHKQHYYCKNCANLETSM